MARDSINRRGVLQIMAGGACLAASPALSGEVHIQRLERLMIEARTHGSIAQRIDFIAGALRGTTYQGYTLIGGPKRPEQFVMRDDAFDCVTFCETVLAAAVAHDRVEFEKVLRTIRYHNGVVTWRERNHYFFEWSQHNVENKLFRALNMDGAVELDKTVYWHPELGKRKFAMAVIPRDIFMANKQQIANGDLIGFVTLRPNLDYFHVGFISHGSGGELLLRHASQRHHRVLDERMEKFLAVNHVRYVTLLRPEEQAAALVKKDG